MLTENTMSDLVGARSPLNTFGVLSLRRRWRLVGMCGVLFLIVGLLFIALRPVTYTASTQLLVFVRELQPGPEPVIWPGRVDLVQVENEIEIIRSRGTLIKVVRSLNLADDVEFAPRPTLFRTIANWAFRTPKAAFGGNLVKQEVAAESLAKHVRAQRVGTSHTIVVSVTTSDARKSARIANAIAQIASQARDNAGQGGSRSPLLRERLRGLGPSAYVMATAGAPGRPDGPRHSVIMAAATIFGIAFGAGLALLLDLMDRTVRTAAQVECLGMECIGAIPRRRRGRREGKNRALSESGSAEGGDLLSHAMLDQTLRRVAVVAESSKARILGVTSAVAGEGAMTVAQCFAQLVARSHRKVLLVDARGIEPVRPRNWGEHLESERAPDHGEQTSSYIDPDETGGLDVLKAGGPDLANAGNTAATWAHYDREIADAYDVIVVALPPLEQGPEFRIAARDLDGILLVLKWGGTEFETVERIMDHSGAKPSEFIGAVLNMIDERVVGEFGDKLWKAEATIVARRRPSPFRVPANQTAG